MPHALLLSPDDQAVSAITGVLAEMSVTCERPLDGPSAAQKLSSHTFDLVLVDCENLPAAKLIFDVCRRPKEGGNPVPIAIVDGRAGLPTAFRLGAELILTKPVAKDQARTTIRTAVNRIKKDDTARLPHPFEEAREEIVTPSAPRAQAAAVGASLPATPPAEMAPPPAPPQVPLEPPAAPIAKTYAAKEEAPPPPVQGKPLSTFARDLTPPQSFAPPKSAPPTPAPAQKPSDDPVLADLESDLPTPAVSSYREPVVKKGSSASLLLLLFLMLAGGFYAAWMYQPGFRETVEPWVNRVLASFQMPGSSRKVAPPQPVSPAPVVTPAPSANGAPSAGAPSSAIPAGPVNPATSGTGRAENHADEAELETSAQSVSLPADKQSASTEAQDADSGSKKIGSAKKILAAVPSDAELPGEKSAVILSSQGAEKRLLHHVSPAYPPEARKEKLEGTVVLKAIVSDTGTVSGVRVIEGNPTLAASAITAVKQWRYRPYVRDGKLMPFQTVVLVEFQRH